MAILGLVGVILLFGGPLCVIPLGLFMGQVTDLTCTRLESRLFDCEIRKSFLGFEWSKTELEHRELLRADVDKRVSQNSSGESTMPTYCVELATDQGSACLIPDEFWAHQGMHDFAGRLNMFIQNPAEKSFTYRYNEGRIWQFLLGGPALGAVGYGLLHGLGKWVMKNEQKQLRKR